MSIVKKRIQALLKQRYDRELFKPRHHFSMGSQDACKSTAWRDSPSHRASYQMPVINSLLSNARIRPSAGCRVAEPMGEADWDWYQPSTSSLANFYLACNDLVQVDRIRLTQIDRKQYAFVRWQGNNAWLEIYPVILRNLGLLLYLATRFAEHLTGSCTLSSPLHTAVSSTHRCTNTFS